MKRFENSVLRIFLGSFLAFILIAAWRVGYPKNNLEWYDFILAIVIGYYIALRIVGKFFD